MRIIFISVLALFLSGCAMLEEMERDWIKRNCNPNAAYNAGLSDGMTKGSLPNRSFADRCPNNRDYLNGVYLDGFTKGLKARPAEVNINKIDYSNRK